jgi:hypothetical protein
MGSLVGQSAIQPRVFFLKYMTEIEGKNKTMSGKNVYFVCCDGSEPALAAINYVCDCMFGISACPQPDRCCAVAGMHSQVMLFGAYEPDTPSYSIPSIGALCVCCSPKGGQCLCNSNSQRPTKANLTAVSASRIWRMLLPFLSRPALIVRTFGV